MSNQELIKKARYFVAFGVNQAWCKLVGELADALEETIACLPPEARQEPERYK